MSSEQIVLLGCGFGFGLGLGLGLCPGPVEVARLEIFTSRLARLGAAAEPAAAGWFFSEEFCLHFSLIFSFLLL